jgi:hypothetical protein
MCFSAEQEADLPECLVFPLILPSDVEWHSLWENADQLAQFDVHILPPPGKVSRGVKSQASRDDLEEVLVTSFRGE